VLYPVKNRASACCSRWDLRQRARKDGKPDPRLAKGAPEE
jgi:hypothetical protein